MISLRTLLVSLALVPFSLSQSTDNAAIQIKAIEAHFSNAGLVPSLLATFDPSALLSFSFSGVGDVSPGTALSQARKLEYIFSVARYIHLNTT